MSILINDQTFQQVLQFFGIRERPAHNYEPLIQPVVQVGDLGQLQTCKLTAGGVITPPNFTLFTVPSGEVWRLLAFTGTISQAGGAAVPVYKIVIADYSSGGGIMPLPIYQEGGVIAGTALTTQQVGTLNSNWRFSSVLPAPILVGSNQRIRISMPQGDGTITIGATIALIHKLQSAVLTEAD